VGTRIRERGDVTQELAQPDTTRFGFIGFGALAQAFAAGLRDVGVGGIAVYTRPRRDPAAAQALAGRLLAAGVRSCSSIQEVVAEANVIIAAVPALAALEVGEGCAPHLTAGALYVDPAPLAPSQKRALSDVIGAAGGEYADVAVLGTVAVDGHTVPMIAAGPGATRWANTVTPLGFRASVLEGVAGQASLVKLLRSVYMKGRDALILEMLLAARRHGVEDAVLASIGGPAEQVPFPELVARVLRSLAVYAERRSAELEAAADLVEGAGVEPLVTLAGAARLRWLAELGIRESFGGERPNDVDAVLRAIDALDPAGPSHDVPRAFR
jgi:3-hydroxyisobutyrate dehydrogenase-like beta-hydroxyacid dehydrogenase